MINNISNNFGILSVKTIFNKFYKYVHTNTEKKFKIEKNKPKLLKKNISSRGYQ
jgi:hypothetical protein